MAISDAVPSSVRVARSSRRHMPRSLRWIGLGLLVAVEMFFLLDHYMGGSDVAPNYRARTTALRRDGITVFAPPDGHASPRAILVFFGNDVGFWAPHRRLADGLARDGYAVVGVDIRPILADQSDNMLLRAETVRARVTEIIAASRAEFSGPHGDPPLVLVGHSLGAELALWSGANIPTKGVSGIIAMSPGARSHLRISASDLLMIGEPEGTDSFAVADIIAEAIRVHPSLRVAVVRGSKDPLRTADERLLMAGGVHIRRFGVPMAGHSMKRLALVGIAVRRALDWTFASSPIVGPVPL